jgi:hypothetical protein
MVLREEPRPRGNLSSAIKRRLAYIPIDLKLLRRNALLLAKPRRTALRYSEAPKNSTSLFHSRQDALSVIHLKGQKPEKTFQ